MADVRMVNRFSWKNLNLFQSHTRRDGEQEVTQRTNKCAIPLFPKHDKDNMWLAQGF